MHNSMRIQCVHSCMCTKVSWSSPFLLVFFSFFKPACVSKKTGRKDELLRCIRGGGISLNVLKVVCMRPIRGAELIRKSRVLTNLTFSRRRCAYLSLKSGYYIKAFRCTWVSVKRIRAGKLCGFPAANPFFKFPTTRTSLCTGTILVCRYFS